MLTIRPQAKPDDTGPLCELMYSSGPGIYDYLHGNRSNALAYIRRELYDTLGFVITGNKRMTGRDGKEYACKKMELFL